jgi:hypothetical protein
MTSLHAQNSTAFVLPVRKLAGMPKVLPCDSQPPAGPSIAESQSAEIEIHFG